MALPNENSLSFNKRRLLDLQKNIQIDYHVTKTKHENKTAKKYGKSEDSMKNNSKWFEGKVEGINSNELLLSKDESKSRLQVFAILITILLLTVSTFLMMITFINVFKIREPIIWHPLGMHLI